MFKGLKTMKTLNTNAARLLALAAVFAMGATAFAAPKTAETAAATVADKGDATAIIAAARKAVTDLKAVSYTVKMSGAMSNVESGGEVTLVKADAGGWKVAAKGENTANSIHRKKDGKDETTTKGTEPANATPFEVTFDGATGHSIVESDKTVFQSSIKDEIGLRNFFASQKAGWVVAWEMIAPAPFAFSANSVATLEGTEDVGGVTCNKIKITTKAPTAKGSVIAHGGAVTTYYFGAQDNFLRRVDRAIGADAEGGRTSEMVQSSAVFTNVKFDTSAVSANFAPGVPDGFIVKPVGGGKRDDSKTDKKMKSEASANGLLAVGSTAPDWTLKTPSGDEVTLSSLKGKVVVLDFWATWCPPCRKAMPMVQKLHDKYNGKNVLVYGLATGERPGGDPAKYMADQKFSYGLLLNAETVAPKYKIAGIPTFYVIGKDGNILFNSVGFKEEEFKEIENVINKEIGKN